MTTLFSCRRTLCVAALTATVPVRAFALRGCDEVPVAAAPAGGWTAPLDTRVSLRVRDVALRDALDRLTALSHVQLGYSADFVPVDRRVCLTADQQPLGELLTVLLHGTNVQVLVVAGRVVLAPGPTAALTAQSDASRGVNVLERVVVTGSAVAAPRRPLVIGVEVIDGDQIRQQALGTMSEMLDASVPGLWSWSQPSSSLVAQYGSIRGASSFGASYPKIYIDGVEVANPLVVTQLNPDVIDRVEVIRGPQGSALYGTDAISGVINVLTRHDGSRTDAASLQLRSSEGAAASAYSTGLVPLHEQRLNLRAGTNVRSAGLSIAYGQTGALFPASESRQIAASGDTRLVTSNATLTATARFFDKRAGSGLNPLLAALLPPSGGSGSPDTPSAGSVLAAANVPQTVRQYTLSTSAAVATQGIWTHTVLAGVDGYSLNNLSDSSGPFTWAVDSALQAGRGNGDRVTLRESSVAHFGDDDYTQATLTLGVEQSVLRQASTSTRYVQRHDSPYRTPIDTLTETWNHDTGIISQLSASWGDALFLTGGLRIEHNDSFSGPDAFPMLPMFGLAAVRSLGEAEVKLRLAYGKGIRPPQTPAHAAASSYSGSRAHNAVGSVLPSLDPEEQSGYEGGVEFYLGHALSLQLTRFDQRVTGLVQDVAVGIDTLSRNGTTERRVRVQAQNVGEITNTGWELQGTLSRGPLSLSSSLSAVDSRVRKLATGYTGDLQAGDRALAVPARTMSLTASFLSGGWFVALGATRAMDWINYDQLAIAKVYISTGASGAELDKVTGQQKRSYWLSYDGDTHLRLTTSRDLTRGVTLLVAGENLLGGQLGEPDNVTIRPGRTITAGLRASF